MNDPYPSFSALILWGLVAATVGHWLCRRRPWVTLFWVAGSTYLPVLALLACAERTAEPVPHYCFVAYVTLAAGFVFPVLGAVAGGLRFWSFGAAWFSRPSTHEPGDRLRSGPVGGGAESKIVEPGNRPGDDA